MGYFNRQILMDDFFVVENYKSYRIIKEGKQGYHWGWWLLWTLCFWPAIFLMGLLAYNRNIYHVVLLDKTGRRDKWWVGEDVYEEIVEKLDKTM